MATTTPAAKIDRQTTTPFLLKLFYRQSAFHRLEEFSPYAHSPPPPHLQIYTWPSCTLRELTHLLVTALPSLLPSPAIGTRLSFRLIFPDTKGAAMAATGGGRGADNGNVPPGRYLSKGLGSVIIGGGGPGVEEDDVELPTSRAAAAAALDRLEGDADKTLADARFVIGDYVSCCILPPGPDGSVATGPPPVPASRGYGPPPSRDYGGRGPGGRENGFGDRYGGGGYGRRGPGPRYDGGRMGGGVPIGEWRRGEIPRGEPAPYGRGRGRPRPY
ncbi:Sin3 associated polypeptide p18-domain-containing protein [Phyllosticta citriasiana]|uniref:Sin3 associated polypeptide p18-domain-containing protein n=1 Tax=Phyllosticta citriasiana TaxID=595635 RepID=A0ABR1KLT7_9PEZI